MRKTFRTLLGGFVAFGLVAVWCILPQTALAVSSQSIAVPLYIQPDKSTFWDDVRTASSASVPFVIANPSNGPGAAALPAYTTAMAKNDTANIKTLGYVQTNYQSRPIKDVYRDIDGWYRLYPSTKGIMIDLVKDGGPVETCYVAALYARIKHARPNDVVVVNPGSNISEAYEPYGDIFVNAATDYESYLTWTPRHTTFEDSPENQNRFWHIVYGVKPDQFSSVFERLRANNAGWVYFTDKSAAAPFSGTPSFWQNEASEVGALPATAIPNRGITSLPRGCISLSASADNSVDTTVAKQSTTTSSVTVNNTSQTYDSEPATTVQVMSLPKGTSISRLSADGWSCDVVAKSCGYPLAIAAGSSPPKVTAVLAASCDYAGGDATLRLSNYAGNRWDVKLPVHAPFGCEASTAAGKLNTDGSGQLLGLTTQSVETTPEITPLSGPKVSTQTNGVPVVQKGLPLVVIVSIMAGALILMLIVALIGWAIYKRRHYKVNL